MSGRAQPENGADSPDGVTYNRFRVLLEEELGARFWMTVKAAMGPNDAKHQAIEQAIDKGYFDVTTIKVELDPGAVPGQATFEEWKDWAGLR